MREQFTKTYLRNGVIYQEIHDEVIMINRRVAEEICTIDNISKDEYQAKFCVLIMTNSFKYSDEAVSILQNSVIFSSFSAVAIITTNYTMRLLSKIIFSESRCPNSSVFNSTDDALNWFKNL